VEEYRQGDAVWEIWAIDIIAEHPVRDGELFCLVRDESEF
jgi:hypothetical protein